LTTRTSPQAAAAVVGKLSPLANSVLQIVGAGPVTYCVAVVVVVTVYAGPINPVAVVPDSTPHNQHTFFHVIVIVIIIRNITHASTK